MLTHLLVEFLDVPHEESVLGSGANPPYLLARVVDLSPQFAVALVSLKLLPSRTPH